MWYKQSEIVIQSELIQIFVEFSESVGPWIDDNGLKNAIQILCSSMQS